MPIDNINDIIAKPGIERATLSILLRHKDRIIEASAENLFAEHFSVKAHQIIYSVCVHLSQNQDIHSLDSTLIYNTITDQSAKNVIEEFGGMEYIDMLIVSPVADNLPFFIKQLKECALLRQTYMLASSMQDDIINKPDSIQAEEILQRFQEQMLNISIEQGEGANVVKFGENTRERLLRRINNPTDVLGLKIGWQTWDKVTQGLCGNDITVIVGESKTGKSTMLLNMAKVLSVDSTLPGLYLDTEMTSEEQEDRMLSIISGVPFEEIRNGMCNIDTEYGERVNKMRAIDEAIVKLEQSPFYHVYIPDFSIDKVTALVRRYKVQYNIQYFIFDYIKLPDNEVRSLQNSAEWQKLGYFTSCLKNLCGICDIPGITAAQANRQSIGNTNQDANSLGGSYRILQLATRLCFIRNKLDYELIAENYSKGNQVLKIAYQRNGSSQGVEIDMQFERPILKMYEIGRRSD